MSRKGPAAPPVELDLKALPEDVFDVSIVRQGYLHQRGARPFRRWQQRYCELTEPYMKLFKAIYPRDVSNLARVYDMRRFQPSCDRSVTHAPSSVASADASRL